MAVESDKVTSFIVEAGEYPDLVQKYQVSGVPKTMVNGMVEILGARPEEDFVRTAVGASQLTGFGEEHHPGAGAN